MESISYHPLLKVSQEEIMLVRKSYNLDVKKINDNLDAIEEWCKKQDHLVEALPYMSRDMLERFHILGRGSIERTKTIIDKVLTMRGMVPELLPSNPRSILSQFEILLDNVLITLLPKTNPIDNSRVLLFRLMNESFEDIDVLSFAKVGCYMLEMRMHYDYIFSDRFIMDFNNIRASAMTKLNPVVLKKVEIMFTNAYKVQIKGYHVINGPPFINKLVSVFKQILKEKIGNRIFVHRSYEELYQEISKEVLPQEYGGDQMSCSNIVDIWRDYLKTEDAKRIIENTSKVVSNESRRNCFRFNEEYLGLPGSFKMLNVD